MKKTPKKLNSGTVWLGIDPGTTIIGYGVIRSSPAGLECIDYGIISNPGKNRSDDLKASYSAVRNLIKKHSPAGVSIERLFFTKNQKTVMSVSEMRGAILLAFAHGNMPVSEFTPLQVKQMICNYGLADKNQVQQMVRKILSLNAVIRPDDAADALALAICASLGRDLS